MKSLITIVVIAAIVAVTLIVTKPTDEQCIDLVKSKVQSAIASSNNNQFFKQMINYGVNLGFSSMKGGFRFEDNTFYKVVYFGDIKVGTAYFGNFNVDGEFENAVARLREQAEEKERIVQEKRSRRIEAIKSLFSSREQKQSVGDDLGTVNRQLDEAYTKLNKLNQFHLLRTKGEKNQQIQQQEYYIQQLEQRKSQLENQQ